MMNSHDLLQIIKSRRSVMPTQYSEKEITSDELNLILESANWAPNHKRTEPWRFTVIQGEAKKRFAEFMLEKYQETTLPEAQSERKKAGIVEKCMMSDKIILISVKTSHLLPEWEELAATAMAVQNMWLMCTALGIGSYWSSPGTISKMSEFTDLEEDENCYGIFYMGKRKGDLHESSRQPIENKVQFIES